MKILLNAFVKMLYKKGCPYQNSLMLFCFLKCFIIFLLCVCVYSSVPLLMLCPLFIMPFSDTLGLAVSQHPHPMSHSCDNQISCHLICEHDLQFHSFFFPVRFCPSCQSSLIIYSCGSPLSQ